MVRGRDIWALAPMGFTMGEFRWFKPTQAFFDHMEQFQGRSIYDVGAGQGHVTRALLYLGHQARALDLCYRDGQCVDIMIANGVLYRYPPGSVVLLCRPCHGPFVESVVERARECGCDVLYVGLERNGEGDLGDIRAEVVAEDVGEDGESIWLVR